MSIRCPAVILWRHSAGSVGSHAQTINPDWEIEVGMSVQLNELIERIKKEGVASAEQEAARIRREAEERAARIVAEARSQAAAVVEQAKVEAAGFAATGKEGVAQAGRDVLLDLKGRITGMLGAILGRRVTAALDADTVKEGLVQLFRNWRSEGRLDYQAVIPEPVWDRIRDALLTELAAEMKRGLEIKPSPAARSGIKIGEKDGAAYYDFTDRGLTEFLMEHLNPKLADCLEEQAG